MLPNSHPIKRIGFFIGEYMTKKLVFGVGVNDADYVVQPRVNGRQLMCPFYQTWTNMIRRCYDAKYKMKYTTYINCTACAEWHKFSEFKEWMAQQDWQGKRLDKDLLIKGNKVYSPEACVFIDGMTNNFVIESCTTKGDWLTGVCLNKPAGKFSAQCSNPFSKKREHLGLFTCQEQAHLAWKRRKHELACQLADLQTDERVAKALRTRYL